MPDPAKPIAVDLPAVPAELSKYPLEVRLFGPIEVRVDGKPLPHLRSRKGLWLLALLALRGGRPVERDWLAGTLWPDGDELHARRSLRQSLCDLRAALGHQGNRLVSDEPRTIRLDLSGAKVDALEFERAAAQSRLDSLSSAVSMYRGPLLEDCAEEWAVEGRARYEQACIQALEALAKAAETRGDARERCARLRSLLAIDRYREDMLRDLMEALTATGNTAGAMQAYRDFRAMLGRELAGPPSAETTALFHSIQQRARTQTTTPRPDSASDKWPRWRTTAPAAITDLIGRDNEVHEVCELISTRRLVTLTGTGGVGKTRLAVHAAGAILGKFEDAAFVDLAPIVDGKLVPEAVRAAIAVEPNPGSAGPTGEICAHLSGKRFLLVVDNCEHVVDDCRKLAEIVLGRCPHVTVLATSRQALSIKGETLWRVPPLATPAVRSIGMLRPSDILPVSDVQDYGAVRLFVERAQAAEPSFNLRSSNAVSVIRICSRLDGIPLAIELAAARVNALPVEKIAARLFDRFRILLRDRGTGAAAVPRHETLRASIEWSFDLLSENERVILSRLAKFAGGWTLDAAEAVCADASVPEWEVADLLSALVAKSLVSYDRKEDRYRLLETIRQYAADRRNDLSDDLQVGDRHLSFYAALAESAEPHLTGPQQANWMDRLEADNDNLRAAISWSLRPDGNVDLGLRMAGALWRFWDMRGHAREGRRWVETLLSRAGKKPTAALAKVLFGAGELAFRYGDLVFARRWNEECMGAYVAIGDRLGIARSRSVAGNIASVACEFDVARNHYEQALAVFRELGDRRNTAVALNNLGNLVQNLGDLKLARALQQENLDIRREIGDQRGIAVALNNLSNVARCDMDFDSSLKLRMECIETYTALGNRNGIADSLTNLGIMYMIMQDYRQAEDHLRRGLELLWDLGDRTGLATNLEAMACVKSCVGRWSEAATIWGSAANLREDLGVPMPPDDAQNHLCLIAVAERELGETDFAAYRAVGETMALPDAVALARG